MIQPLGTRFEDDQDCIHGLPEGQCSDCTSRFPKYVWITDGGAAYHVTASCKGLEEGQDHAYGLGFRIHTPRKVSRVRAESEGYMSCRVCLDPVPRR